MIISESSFENRRQHKRHQLSAEISIINQFHQQALGKVVDLHQEGMLILGCQLNLQSPHQITVVLPNSVNLQSQFNLGIECLWSQPADEDESFFWTGCSIIDKSDVAMSCIESLINLQT